MKTISQISEIIRSSVSVGRYAHILRVADMARKLAEFWEIDPDQAYLAGLVHDSAKQFSPESLRRMGIGLDDYLDDVFTSYPKVWHALVADQYCKVRFEIDDVVVLDAVRWHTTGKDRMSDLAKITFIADYIEPQRDVKPRPYIETLAYRHLDDAVFALSTVSLYYLLVQGWAFHPYTVECRNYYLGQISPDMVKLIVRDISHYF